MDSPSILHTPTLLIRETVTRSSSGTLVVLYVFTAAVEAQELNNTAAKVNKELRTVTCKFLFT